jgi:ribosomal protein L37AE/L43A
MILQAQNTMKLCAYCGRDNVDEALNCRECGTEFEHPAQAPDSQALQLPDVENPEPLSEASGALKCIASLSVDLAVELLVRLKKEGIPAQIKRVTQEGELEYGDVLVQECNFDRACDLAETWDAESRAEAERRSNRFCPSCGSRHLEPVTTEPLGTIWKCKDCGNAFAK